MKKDKTEKHYYSVDLAERGTGAGLLFRVEKITVVDGRVTETETGPSNYLPIVMDIINKDILKKMNNG